jgi:hypothetical protein
MCCAEHVHALHPISSAKMPLMPCSYLVGNSVSDCSMARGKRQEARGKRQEARGKRQETRDKRQETRDNTQEARGDR